jgi:hypothetical protein
MGAGRNRTAANHLTAHRGPNVLDNPRLVSGLVNRLPCGGPGLRLPMLVHSGVLQACSSHTVAGAVPESFELRTDRLPI